jgi:hypothetical protein
MSDKADMDGKHGPTSVVSFHKKKKRKILNES